MPTTRQTPVGSRLKNGHSTLYTFAADPDISFWEISVKPVGLDGGDAIDTTTMHNTTMRTMAPRTLKTATEMQVVAAYDPVFYDQILALINVETLCTITFPNGDKVDVYAYLKAAEFNELVEGTQPQVTLTIVPTNVNPSTGAEVAPNYITATGTD